METNNDNKKYDSRLYFLQRTHVKMIFIYKLLNTKNITFWTHSDFLETQNTNKKVTDANAI